MPRHRNKTGKAKARSSQLAAGRARLASLQKAPQDALRVAGASGDGGSVESIDCGGDDLTQRNIETIARIERAAHERRTVGERVADLFAATVGSWTFIIIQTVVLVVWMILNVVAWMRHWDPYPFILLNLALSFQAAYAAPIIMMSQNRQSRLSDHRNQLDLQINLLAEQENTEMLRMLRRVCAHLGLESQSSASVDALEQATSPEELLNRIEKVESQSAPAPQNGLADG